MSATTDSIQACTAVASIVVSIISAGFVVFSIRQASKALVAQRSSTDVETTLSIFEKLDAHWVRFIDAAPERREFEFGQLITYYEMTCHLFKCQIFSTNASLPLYQHLQDILPVMQENQNFSDLFEKLKTQPDTYENIFWLCNRSTRISK